MKRPKKGEKGNKTKIRREKAKANPNNSIGLRRLFVRLQGASLKGRNAAGGQKDQQDKELLVAEAFGWRG
jgi:hypothetical protein